MSYLLARIGIYRLAFCDAERAGVADFEAEAGYVLDHKALSYAALRHVLGGYVQDLIMLILRIQVICNRATLRNQTA